MPPQTGIHWAVEARGFITHSTTPSGRAEKEAAESFDNHYSGNHDEGVLHQGLPLFTPLGLIDGKEDEADSGNLDHNAQQAKDEADDFAIQVFAENRFCFPFDGIKELSHCRIGVAGDADKKQDTS